MLHVVELPHEGPAHVWCVETEQDFFATVYERMDVSHCQSMGGDSKLSCYKQTLLDEQRAVYLYKTDEDARDAIENLPLWEGAQAFKARGKLVRQLDRVED